MQKHQQFYPILLRTCCLPFMFVAVCEMAAVSCLVPFLFNKCFSLLSHDQSNYSQFPAQYFLAVLSNDSSSAP
jgi:hypothetical protein